MADSGRISKQNWVARLATAFLLGSLFLSLSLGASSSKDSFTPPATGVLGVSGSEETGRSRVGRLR